MGQPRAESLEAHLESCRNYIAEVLGVTKTDYADYLEQYFFIGLQSQLQESFNRLADAIGKPHLDLPRINQGITRTQKFPRDRIDESCVETFRQHNQLDYAIYDYCRERFERYHGFQA